VTLYPASIGAVTRVLVHGLWVLVTGPAPHAPTVAASGIRQLPRASALDVTPLPEKGQAR
jgi:hypothetical protein